MTKEETNEMYKKLAWYILTTGRDGSPSGELYVMAMEKLQYELEDHMGMLSCMQQAKIATVKGHFVQLTDLGQQMRERLEKRLQEA